MILFTCLADSEISSDFTGHIVREYQKGGSFKRRCSEKFIKQSLITTSDIGKFVHAFCGRTVKFGKMFEHDLNQ